MLLFKIYEKLTFLCRSNCSIYPDIWWKRNTGHHKADE